MGVISRARIRRMGSLRRGERGGGVSEELRERSDELNSMILRALRSSFTLSLRLTRSRSIRSP